MRKTYLMPALMSAALLGLGAGPLAAQPATPGGSTAGTPGSTGPGSTGIVPGTGGTMPSAAGPQGMAPMSSTGGAMGDSGSGGTGMTGMRPMRGQQQYRSASSGMRRAVPVAKAGKPVRGGGHIAPASVAQDNGVDVPRTGDYRGGVGSPYSERASNITGSDTRSEMAPRLPDPAAGGNTPEAYLAAAQRALASNRTGAAQEALERAETRILTRSTDPSLASVPDNGNMAQQIGAARRALAAGNVGAARAAISAAMGRG